jgi:imidazolonepropionase
MNEWDSVWEAKNISLAVKDEHIVWVGNTLLEGTKAELKGVRHRVCPDAILTPGLIDPHTHLVYGGERWGEFERRLKGESYADIAKSGGGIRLTVAETRKMSIDALFEASRGRLEAMLKNGVTTVEIKSGYGLNLETELKMLRVAKQLGEALPVHVVPTFLGAHTVPKEYEGKADDYIDYLCQEVLPCIKEEGLAQAVDVFCESIGFSLSQTQKVFECALSLGFDIKCHAEQLSLLGATDYAAQHKALSCDHLEYLDEKGVEAMAQNDTVAVLLPGAYYFLKETKKPPVECLRNHGVKIAIATDCNPGSSPTTSLPLMMNMACVLFGLTIDEAWSAVTENAAHALGLKDRGQIAVGQRADFCLWPIKDKATLCYEFGSHVEPEVVFAGKSCM